MNGIIDELRSRSLIPGDPIGSGMEGEVFAVQQRPDLVIKIWRRRDPADLERLRLFTSGLSSAGLAIAFPQVQQIVMATDGVATVESAVPGVPLGSGGPRPVVTEAQADVLMDALMALADVQPRAELALLPPLPGEQPFDPEAGFGASLADLIARRHRAHADVLTAHQPDVGRLVGATAEAVRSIEPAMQALIHGDLVPSNLMIVESAHDGAPRLSGVLDFGFLTVVGDPAFDAAVTSSIFDMYGENARRSEAILDEHIADRFRYPSTTLAIYRAAWAIITANAFGADGADGHFAWCIAMLNRPEVRSALGVR
ncbi:phosphotransferase family protein [Microlunatus soli]|uniref:Predicted kinase, aminoglycoside phosphotransferase (APT) family n=1 Tax=Microlunatus soli TaxID=630515 RepID=A0A1H1VFT2_9ACTN|nr:phosphotransferase [Microlunatus soli]SDS83632.1 Predicted kinase, aminoglycoside phosphotransferase (APT) family [Microlunatus soli]